MELLVQTFSQSDESISLMLIAFSAYANGEIQ